MQVITHIFVTVGRLALAVVIVDVDRLMSLHFFVMLKA